MTTLAVLFAAALVAGEPKHHPQATHAPKPTNHPAPASTSIQDEMKAMIHSKSQHHTQAPAFRAGGNGYSGRPYHSSNGYRGGYHHHDQGRHYQHQQTWPGQTDPSLAGLQMLKHSLDQVHRGQSATGSQAIERALMRTIEVAHPPSVASVRRLAGHLTTALAGREASTINTEALALALRAGINSPNLIAADRAQVHTSLQHTLQAGRVQPNHVASVLEAVKTLEHEEQTRHR